MTITLKSYSPAKNRQGGAVSSYSTDRKGNSLVKTGVARDTRTFDTIADALLYVSKHPGPAYEIVRPHSPKGMANA